MGVNFPRRFTSVPVHVGPEAIESWLDSLREPLLYAISIGNHHGKARTMRHRALQARGLKPLSLRHPTAYVEPDASLGEACHLMAFAYAGVRCAIGDAVILNTHASVDHECVLGDGVHIAVGAHLAGRVTIGDNTFVGSGATIGPDVTIAPDCIIGAGATVVRDITEPGTYVGVPARRIR